MLAVGATTMRAGGISITESDEAEDSQASLRENPVMESSAATSNLSPTELSAYPYLNLKSNEINYNGADWSRLRNLLDCTQDTVISILHIGDSHIQAEGSTSRTRALLQNRYGSAGRGLITPFRIAGTNQPIDYTISSSSDFTTAKLLKQPWSIEMGFSGIAIQPNDKNFEIVISTTPTVGIEAAFNRIRVFYSGAEPVATFIKNSIGAISFEQTSRKGYIDLLLDESTDEATLNFTSSGRCTISAFDLQSASKGIKYSAIGNNGATYSSYNSLGSFGRDINPLAPDLVIISMGCNEAFGKISDAAMRSSIDLMVKNIHRANPQAQILLTTPADCQRKVVTRKRIRKRRYRTVTSYRNNENIDRLRRVILDYGRDNKIATYDWYTVAGGAYSSQKWIDDKLMSNDRIHLTRKGYTLMGELLYDAVFK